MFSPIKQLVVMQNLITNYVEDDKDGVVSRCTARFRCGTLADPSFDVIAPLITSFGPAILTHNWNGTQEGKNGKPGKDIPLTPFQEEREWSEKYFNGKDKSNRTLRKLYFKSQFAAGFAARNTLHANAVPGLKIGPVLGKVIDPKLYIWVITKIWGPFFEQFPYSPIYLSGNEWATIRLM